MSAARVQIIKHLNICWEGEPQHCRLEENLLEDRTSLFQSMLQSFNFDLRLIVWRATYCLVVSPSGKSEMWWWLRAGYKRKGEDFCEDTKEGWGGCFLSCGVFQREEAGKTVFWCLLWLCAVVQQKWWRGGSCSLMLVWAYWMVCMTCISVEGKSRKMFTVGEIL